MSAEVMKAVVASYYNNIAAMNTSGVLENFAQDAISHDPVGEPAAKVHEGFSEFLGRLQAVFEKLETVTEHIFTSGNSAAVKWTTQGTAKSGKIVTFEGITVFEFNEAGKIQTTHAYWSPAAMIAQLRS
ncbi:MAG: nuclear transport factor 2 family protein [Scytonematopsis contorta HA4267-MV1]|jgi:steroid delta-isomerase|nr:nuclear transport factor 2 family protein [Scytonematopsis contorta HA4267-MV1]